MEKEKEVREGGQRLCFFRDATKTSRYHGHGKPQNENKTHRWGVDDRMNREQECESGASFSKKSGTYSLSNPVANCVTCQ
jgi:hypothetical protein